VPLAKVRTGENKKCLVMLAVISIFSIALTDEPANKGAKEPLGISFKDLKWTELPERPDMKFAVISGNPKNGPYTQYRKVPAGTDNPLHSHY
jgi:hypothetical protein